MYSHLFIFTFISFAWGDMQKNISKMNVKEPFPSLGDLPDQGIEPMTPVLAGMFFTTEPSGKPLV